MSWFVYVVRLRDEFSREDRDRILARYGRRGSPANNYFAPNPPAIVLSGAFRLPPRRFPVAEHVADRTIALPFFNLLAEDGSRRVSPPLARAIRSLPDRSNSPA